MKRIYSEVFWLEGGSTAIIISLVAAVVFCVVMIFNSGKV